MGTPAAGSCRVLETRGKRILTEFVCYCKKKYIYVWLNTGLNGNHGVQCPNKDCTHGTIDPQTGQKIGHIHYRVIKNGAITKERFNESLPIVDMIHPMPSACQEVPRKLGLIAKARQLEAAGLHK